MKNNQHAGLKKQSTENSQRCFKLLVSAKQIHEDAVVFDATLSDKGEVELGVYTYDDEPLLQVRAGIFSEQPNIRELVASASDGTLVSVLTDEEKMPSWVQTHGMLITNGVSVDGSGEEADD